MDDVSSRKKLFDRNKHSFLISLQFFLFYFSAHGTPQVCKMQPRVWRSAQFSFWNHERFFLLKYNSASHELESGLRFHCSNHVCAKSRLFNHLMPCLANNKLLRRQDGDKSNKWTESDICASKGYTTTNARCWLWQGWRFVISEGKMSGKDGHSLLQERES